MAEVRLQELNLSAATTIIHNSNEFLSTRTFTLPYMNYEEFSLIPQRRILDTCRILEEIHKQTLTIQERDILYHTFEVVARSLRMAIPRNPGRFSDFVDTQSPIIMFQTEPLLRTSTLHAATKFNNYSQSIAHTHTSRPQAHICNFVWTGMRQQLGLAHRRPLPVLIHNNICEAEYIQPSQTQI